MTCGTAHISDGAAGYPRVSSVIMPDVDLGAIVLAGGAGSRLRPLTDDVPKPLLPLGGEPLIGYQLRRLARLGVRRVVLATGYLADRFEADLADGSRWGVALRHSVEEEPLGTGGALRAASELLPRADRVIVLNGDLLSSHDLAGQLAATGSAAVCLHVRAVPDIAAYGAVTCGDDGSVRAFAEKSGRGPGLANAGTYVVDAEVLRSIRPGRSSWEREVLPALISSGAPVVAWPGAGYFRDVGTPSAYRLACVDAATGVLPDAAAAGSGAYVDARSQVASDVSLVGGSSVHAGAVVEPGAQLDGTVLLPGSRVGAGSTLVRCVVAADSTVPADTTLRDALVDELLLTGKFGP